MPGKDRHGRGAPPPGWGLAHVGENVVADTRCWRSSLVQGHQKNWKQPAEAWNTCYLAETKMVAWNGCLAARSCEHASLPELCKNQTIAGFFLAEAVSPVPIPEELTQSA